MTDDELREIEERAEAATPGPWVWTEGMLQDTNDRVLGNTILWPNNALDYDAVPNHDTQDDYFWSAVLGACGDRAEVDAPTNAAFIAHARENVPALVAEVRRLWAENADLRERLEQKTKALINAHDDEARTRTQLEAIVDRFPDIIGH